MRSTKIRPAIDRSIAVDSLDMPDLIYPMTRTTFVSSGFNCASELEHEGYACKTVEHKCRMLNRAESQFEGRSSDVQGCLCLSLFID
jgi:hypothetical protein